MPAVRVWILLFQFMIIIRYAWPETVAMVPLVPFFRYGNTGSAFCISSHLCPLVFDDGA